MSKFIYCLFLFVVFIVNSKCQNVHYVPAILVPVVQNNSYQGNYPRPNDAGWNVPPPNWNNQPNYNNSNYGWNNGNWNRTNYPYPPPPNWNNNNWNRTNYPYPPPPNWNNNNWNNYNRTTDQGNVILGNINNLDKLLYSQEFSKESKWWSGRDKTIDYPSDLPVGHVRQEVINSIRIYNLNNTNIGKTHARIIRGGLGQKYVKILLTSDRGVGFKYLVQLFGH